MNMSAKFEAKNETFGASFEQTDSTFDADFSNVGGGQDGKDGATFIPSVSEEGVISWTNNGNLPNPTPVNIKGEKGADGKDGTNGIDGKDGHTPVITIQNGYWYVDGVNTQVKAEGVDGKDGINGKDGIDGENGKDGADGKDGASITVISITESTEDNGFNVVTFSDGKTITVKNGSKGSQGEKGDQGERGEKGEQGIQGAQGVQGIQGEQGIPGVKGDKGDTYTLTDADKEEIAEQAAEKVDISNLATVDKVKGIDTWYGGKTSVSVEGPDGISWEDTFAFCDETNAPITEGYIYHNIPIVAGNNVEFEVDEENQVVKINVSAIGDISSALDELHAYAQALVNGGGA